MRNLFISVFLRGCPQLFTLCLDFFAIIVVFFAYGFRKNNVKIHLLQLYTSAPQSSVFCKAPSLLCPRSLTFPKQILLYSIKLPPSVALGNQFG